MNDEPSSGQTSNDPEQEGTITQDKDEAYRKERDVTVENPDDNGAIVANRDELFEILSRIQIDTLYPAISARQSPLQMRIQKGAMLALQQMEYVRLMEDRMRDMEKRVRLIENKGVDIEAFAPPEEVLADCIMDIKRMTFQEFIPIDSKAGNTAIDERTKIQHKRRHTFPSQLPYHLIDVVVGGINQPDRLGKDQVTKSAAGSDPAAPRPTTTDQDLTVHETPSVQPERIRINSPLLLRILERITNMSFNLSNVNNDWILQDQVILRPFKLFVNFEQEIRDEIDRLEKIHTRNDSKSQPPATKTAKHEDESPPNPQSTDENSQNPSIDASVGKVNEQKNSLETRRCLEELCVLRELLDKDLKPTFDLRRQIKDGSTRSIAFQDLWHLFSIGSEVVSNGVNGQSQNYRILDVSGGKPFLCSRIDAHMDRGVDPLSSGEEVPKFDILSYFYDFDGTDFGACSQLHTIKSYDGNKAIISLPCFPLIYSKHYNSLKPRDFFIGRGKRFVELIRQTEVVHKRYSGLTQAMDGLREEVR